MTGGRVTVARCVSVWVRKTSDGSLHMMLVGDEGVDVRGMFVVDYAKAVAG